MFKKFKLNIGHSRLRKQLKVLTRQKRVHNLDSARKIGIISYASSDYDFEQALKLTSHFTGKNLEVSLIAFFPGKELPHSYLMRKNVDIFVKKELNWYGKPIAPFANEFISREFDILIDLSMQEIFPLKWIASLSKAKFKVGCLSYYHNPNDLIINIKTEDKLDYFISQLMHYLHLINNRFAQEEERRKENLPY
jgi:hypothetical protein